jgi:NitT/TauT family transport system substrate-binding protein
MRFLNLRTTTIAMAAVAALAAPASAQAPLTKISVMEPIHSLFYAPLYAAMNKGFFKQEGIEIDLAAAQGSDKATAALLAGSAQVVLVGPETAIYIQNGQSPLKTKIISGLTATDGSFLVGRKKEDNFNWASLKGKQVLSWRKGSAPGLFMEAALRKNGLDPDKDVTLITNTAIPARMGAFIGGQADYGTFFEPDVSRMVADGKGVAIANVGKAVGNIDYTVFVATDDLIAKNPKLVQGFTNAIARSLAWIDKADPKEAAEALAPAFSGIPLDTIASSVVRHREAGIWKKTPLVEPQAIEDLQALLITSNILKPDQKVPYDKVVAPAFAKAAR